MAKTAAQQIQLEIELISDAEKSLEIVHARRDWARVGLNLWSIFHGWHYSALAASRLGDARAVSFLKSAIETASRAKLVLNMHKVEGAVPAEFCFEAANLLGLLSVSRGSDFQQFEIYSTDILPVSDRNLSVLLFERLTGRVLSADWIETLSLLNRNKRAKLAVETYETYGRIIDAVSREDMTLAQEEARRASHLFDQRSRSPYYIGGPSIAGGGPANEFVIDYELAAIQRRYFDAPAPGAELHWWRW